MFREEISAHQHAHAPGDLAHGFEQRQTAVHLDGFIGDAGGPRFHQRLGERLAGGEVQIGEENLAGPQQGQFDGQRFLDLDDEFGLGKNLLVRADELGAGGLVFRIRITGTDARAGFDDDDVAAFDELIRAAGQQGDTIFLFLNFLWDANDHKK